MGSCHFNSITTVLKGAVCLSLTRQRTFYAESSIGERVEQMCVLKQRPRHKPLCFLELRPALVQSQWVPSGSPSGAIWVGLCWAGRTAGRTPWRAGPCPLHLYSSFICLLITYDELTHIRL